MSEHIIERDTLEMYKEDQAKYSIVVNRRRNIPAIQDSLKPVQRRILFAAYNDHMTSPNKIDKSASLVGTTMKYYHPHGDSSIYDAIVTLASWFKIKYPLMYGHGNWGALDGSGAAASRYTECSLSEFGYDIMIDEMAQSNNIIDWIDTYKRNGDKEPEYLACKLPILLINGAFGIGIGMQCSIPSHNLAEVVDATLALIKNPNAKFTLIPDLCQPCDLINTDWNEICETGCGNFKVRGRIVTEKDKKGNYILHIVSLPDQTNTTIIYDKINAMIADKKLPMIKDIYNSLDPETEGSDIRIHLRPGADPGYVKQTLYAKTPLQSDVRVNFEVVQADGININVFSYRTYLLQFIDSRLNIKFRLYCNKLQKVMTKHYQYDAFIKVIESGQLEKVIKMIRSYKGTDVQPIIDFMIKNCGISDIQAKFILNVKLPQLSAGHLKEYKAKRKEVKQKMDTYMKAVTDDGTIIKNELIAELKELKKKYARPRLCTVINASDDDDIPAGTFKIVVTEKNFIRKIPDIDKVGIVRKDNPKFIIRVDNRDNILLFDNKGKVFKVPVSKFAITDRSEAGTDIRMINKYLTSDIVAVFDEEVFKKIAKSNSKHYIVVLTRMNIIKKLDIEDFLNVGASGLMYSKIKPEDTVVGLAIVPHNLDIAICSGKKALRCHTKDVPLLKRSAAGSKAMNTTMPINGLSVFYPNVTDVVVVTRNGKFNRFNAGLLDCKGRAKGGNVVIKLDKNDEILNIYGVNKKDKIHIVASDGIEDINVEDIKEKSSIAAGQKMTKTKGIIIRADVVYN